MINKTNEYFIFHFITVVFLQLNPIELFGFIIIIINSICKGS